MLMLAQLVHELERLLGPALVRFHLLSSAAACYRVFQ
jgi:hypothetical protein